MAKSVALLPVTAAEINGVSVSLQPGGIVLDIAYRVMSEEAIQYKSASITVNIAYDDTRTLAQLVSASLVAINAAEGLA